ncbi:hypothetical protein [uncultured Corynebacterium sp.]|uniref:hypothetical protein n=1 Tax=uncultured Corynebacterium sp. TaxID=159447 RepID=UPI002599AEFD|nr:hypothetical protein [uncultured Corynebacterium sp.]
MRNFRTAAVASATALTIAFGGVATASAQSSDAENNAETTTSGSAVFSGKQDGDKDFGDVIKDGTKGLFNNQGSSQYFNDTDEPFFAADAGGKEKDIDNIPQWGRYWIDGTVVAAIGSLVGLVIAGFNWASYNGWIKF